MASDQLIEVTGYAHVALVSQLTLGVCLFAATVLHLRFVSHVNPNPPEPKPVRPTPNVTIEREEAFTSPTAISEPPARAPQRRRANGKTVRVDPANYEEFEEDEVPQKPYRRTRTRREGPPTDSLKGLTMKQRKQARKEHREQQRALERGYKD